MKNQYTRKQIQESIDYWKNVLKENYGMTEAELDEGIFKKAVDAAKDKVSGAVKSVKDAVGNAKEKVHDTFKTNKQVGELLTALSQAKDAKAKEDAVKIGAKIGDKQYPIVSFQVDKNKLAVKILNAGKCATIKNLRDALNSAKVKKISSAIDGITIVPVKNFKAVDNNKLQSIQYLKKDKAILFTFDAGKQAEQQKKADDELFS